VLHIDATVYTDLSFRHNISNSVIWITFEPMQLGDVLHLQRTIRQPSLHSHFTAHQHNIAKQSAATVTVGISIRPELHQNHVT